MHNGATRLRFEWDDYSAALMRSGADVLSMDEVLNLHPFHLAASALVA